MKRVAVVVIVYAFASLSIAQLMGKPAAVPMTLDHNRIIVDVQVPQPDGAVRRLRAWVDTGNPELWITESAAKLIGLEFSEETRETDGLKVGAVRVAKKVTVGDTPVDFSGVKEVRLMSRGSVGPGLSADINLPSTVLRNFDVVIDYPGREFMAGPRGTIEQSGPGAKIQLNPENGLIQVPATIEGQDCNLGFDIGASFSFLSSDIVSHLRKAHPQWPHVTGAVGEANMWGFEDEPTWELVRIPRMKYGTETLMEVGFASFRTDFLEWFQRRAGVPTCGLLGADALLAYRLGIDYAHGSIYFHRTGGDPLSRLDVVGLILKPREDQRYAILGVADFDGKPSVPDVRPGDLLIAVDESPVVGTTMGQVWSLLGGRPGDVRTLTLVRDGKPFAVKAMVHRFLDAAEAAADSDIDYPERRTVVPNRNR